MFRAIAEEGQGASSLKLAMSPGGYTAVWVEASGLESNVNALTADGTALTRETLSRFLTGPVDDLALAQSAAGAVVAWRQLGSSSGAVYWAEKLAGEGWSTPDEGSRRLSYGGGGYDPSVALNDRGDLVIAWNQHRVEGLGVAVATRSSEGPISAPTQDEDLLSLPINFANEPRVALDRDGRAIIAWYQSPVGPLRTFVSERAHGGVAFPMAKEAISPEGGPVEAPVPAIGQDGSAVVVWRQQHEEQWAVHLSHQVGDGLWMGGEQPFSTEFSAIRVMSPLYVPSEGLVVGWEATSTDGTPSIFLAVRDASGSWSAPGASPLRLNSSRSFDLAMASTPDGLLIVAYVEEVADEWNVVAHLNPHRGGHRTVLGTAKRGDIASVAAASDTASERVIVGWIESGVVQLAELD